MCRKQHFMAITHQIARQPGTPFNNIHGQKIFKTMIQFPNHEQLKRENNSENNFTED